MKVSDLSSVFALLPAFVTIAPFSWFIGALIDGGIYWLAMKFATPAREAILKSEQVQ